MKFRSEVCSGSCHPSYAMICLSEIDSAKSVEDLRTSGSSLEHNLPNLETLEAMIANSLNKLLGANDFREKVLFIEGAE